MEHRQSPPWLCCWFWLGSLSVACGGAVENDSSSSIGTVATGGVQATGGLSTIVAGGASSLPSTPVAGAASSLPPTPVSGGASSLPANTGIGGTRSPASATGTGGTTSLLQNTGGLSGCISQGQWHVVYSTWQFGSGCNCWAYTEASNRLDAGNLDAGDLDAGNSGAAVSVMQSCTQCVCQSDGYSMCGTVEYYCPIGT